MSESHTEWKFLTPSKHFWRTQLFVMGSKVPASDVWTAMLAYNQTIEEAAAIWNFPPEAIEEILEYCQANQELLAQEEAEELRLSKTWGVGICAYS
ncbi:hypothetical protein BH11CYA1_BH11CYA1_29480 [soil metagenome]